MKRFGIICLLLSLCLSLLSCGKTAPDETVNVRNKLAFSVPGAVTGEMNPFYATEEGDLAALALMTGTFFGGDDIAEMTERQLADGNYLVTVDISEKAVCADKSGIFSTDLIYAVQLVCDPTYHGPYTALAQSSLVGLSEFRSGEVTAIAGINRVNERRAEFTFAEKEDFRTLLNLPAVRTSNYGGFTYGRCAREDIVAKRAKVMGYGPYQIDQWIESDNKMINLKRNEYYFGGQAGTREISLRSVSDADVGLNMQLGQLTAGFLHDKEEAARQAEQYGYTAIMLKDGALLCQKKAAFAKKLGEEHTIIQAIALVGSQL